MTVEASRTRFLCVFGVADGAAEVVANAAHPLLLDNVLNRIFVLRERGGSQIRETEL